LLLAGLPLASKAGDETTRGIMQVIKQDWQICLVMRFA